VAIRAATTAPYHAHLPCLVGLTVLIVISQHRTLESGQAANCPALQADKLVAHKARVVFVSSVTARTCVIQDPRLFLTSWWHAW
jgi:hypothetical protein